MNRKQHWNHVFRTKTEQDLSWFELLPETSLQLLEANLRRRPICGTLSLSLTFDASIPQDDHAMVQPS